jgi:putative toxin-antitoxin system antitoxin component (TIGR02293 family)
VAEKKVKSQAEPEGETRLASSEREVCFQRETLISHAIEVIGDEQEAMRWLGTPVRALDYSTPISSLNTAEGRAKVLAVLDKLQHGVL